MKSVTTGTLSGCVVYIIVFFFLLTCLVPLGMGLGGVTSTISADFVARTLEPYLCPDGSHAEIITFQTTSTDEFGNESPATGFEMQCVNARGEITRPPSPDYAFIWIGVIGVASLILAALLSFVLAAPAGVIIGRLLGRTKTAQ
jgi:hypothetical protein